MKLRRQAAGGRWRATSVAIGCLIAAACILQPAASQEPAPEPDPLLRAMKDELERSRRLRIISLDLPYFIEYRVADETNYSVNASLGALVASSESSVRIPLVSVRVGDYAFDNTNHIYSEAYSGSRYDPDQLATDGDYVGFRYAFWLATDRAYKTAEDAIARKRSSLKNMNLPDQIPDFSKVPRVETLLPVRTQTVNESLWKDRVVKLSAIFDGYPRVLSSAIEMQISQATNYLVNSEGTVLRTPENLSHIRILARSLAADGTQVRDAQVIQAFDAAGLPAETELHREVTEVADHVTALSQAPAGEAYDGPVLFEAAAAAQLFGQLLGDNLKITRKPIVDAGRNAPYYPSELENRVGSRILPEWMDVVDDPTQTEWHGHTLLGHYLYDIEGVSPTALTLVEKGTLKTFLLTRTPVLKSFDSSNGRARMTGAFGADDPGFGNLFVRATQTIPLPDLKKKLIDLCRERNKPYGMLVRKLDYPSSASIDELRRLAQSSGSARPASLPLLVYRVYPDGREELVRSLRFRGASTHSLKDIVAASDETYVFDFIDSNAPLALMGAGSFTTSASVIAPSLLFDELEFEPVQEETPKPPIVPPPPLGGAATIGGKQAAGGRRQENPHGVPDLSSSSCRLPPAACLLRPAA
jgi:PmbA/TldA metallopeptidase C-terminal domain